MEFTLENIEKLLCIKDKKYDSIWVEIETGEFGRQHLCFNKRNFKRKFIYFNKKIKEEKVYIKKVEFS